MAYKGRYKGAAIDDALDKANSSLQGRRVNITPTGYVPQAFLVATPSGDPMHELYVAVGALYNNTDADIEKDTPWISLADDSGKVWHRKGCWYLNGLGDITTEQMRKIYVRGYFNDADLFALGYSGANSIRTNIGRAGGQNGRYNSAICPYNGTMEVVNLSILVGAEDYSTQTLAAAQNYFTNSKKIRHIIGGFLDATSITAATFQGMSSLETIRIKTKQDLSLKDSPNISKKSILYAINNVATTSAIKITLHATAYARLNNDSDITSALASHTNVTLQSA